MDRDRMEQYLVCCQRVQETQEKIERKRREPDQAYADVVKGSSPCFPYTERPIPIEGYNSGDPERHDQQVARLILRLEKQKVELAQIKQDLEQYIDSLEDVQLRRILSLKYLDGLTYGQIARRIGGKNSSAAIKMRVKRYFEKK